MLFCDTEFASPEETLAADEALLDACEAGELGPLLRVWIPRSYFVVVGYANSVDTEVNLAFCRERRIPVLRRCTGGGTVLQGPGCLNYSLVLPIEPGGPLGSIHGTNCHVLRANAAALAPLLGRVPDHEGDTDLALGGLKIAGNAQRRRKRFLLFHGCFLLDLDLGMAAAALPMPSRQPVYRGARSHRDFLLNLKLLPESMTAALRRHWNAFEGPATPPHERIGRLVREKYATDAWNRKF